MIIGFLLTLFFILLFLFSFWRRLREDYLSSQIFATAFYILLGYGVGNIISDNFFPDFWFWTCLASGILGFFLGVFRFKLRIFETLEAAVISSLFLLSLIFGYNFLTTQNIFTLLGFCTLLLLIIGFYLIDRHYKRFTWYKSGRVGFTGTSILGLLFLIRTVVAISEIPVLSFVGQKEVIISATLAFISFLAVFNLSRSAQ